MFDQRDETEIEKSGRCQESNTALHVAPVAPPLITNTNIRDVETVPYCTIYLTPTP